MASLRSILVAGRSGQLAHCLCDAGEAHGLSIVSVGRPELDLEHRDLVEAGVRAHRPAAIVNAAAYTAVDKAEHEPDRAFAVNRDGPGYLAAAARQAQVPFIHVSTDYVFDGEKPSAYAEEDPTGPMSVYGRSKLAGEHAVLEACPDAIILRTSWIYSPYGSNFLKTMLRLARSQPIVRVVNDQRGAPTAAADLAQAILQITTQALAGHPARGIYHATNRGPTTWHGFAEAIFASLERRGAAVPQLQPITTAEYPTPARRPANSLLDCSKLSATFGLSLPHWSRSLERCLDHLVDRKQEFAV